MHTKIYSESGFINLMRYLEENSTVYWNNDPGTAVPTSRARTFSWPARLAVKSGYLCFQFENSSFVPDIDLFAKLICSLYPKE